MKVRERNWKRIREEDRGEKRGREMVRLERDRGGKGVEEREREVEVRVRIKIMIRERIKDEESVRNWYESTIGERMQAKGRGEGAREAKTFLGC